MMLRGRFSDYSPRGTWETKIILDYINYQGEGAQCINLSGVKNFFYIHITVVN